MLDTFSRVPLYEQIVQAIKADIEKGILKKGEKLDSENLLIHKYNVSRITVRKAIAELVKDNILYKRQGKGTFVLLENYDDKISYNATIDKDFSTLSFTEMCKNGNLIPSTKVLEVEKIYSKEIAKKLDLAENASLIYTRRLKLANNKPLMLEENYFSYDKYPFLLEEDLNLSLYKMLREKYHIYPVANVNMEIEILYDDKISQIMGISAAEPLFYQNLVVIDENEKPIHFCKHYIISNRTKFIF